MPIATMLPIMPTQPTVFFFVCIEISREGLGGAELGTGGGLGVG